MSIMILTDLLPLHKKVTVYMKLTDVVNILLVLISFKGVPADDEASVFIGKNGDGQL